MRLLRAVCLFALALGLAAPAYAADDPRVTLLSKQLSTAKDPRNRVQIVVLLGHTKHSSAAPPLCAALADAEPLVRSAAASALAEVGGSEATACLRDLRETDDAVQASIARALAAIDAAAKRGSGTATPQKGSLYISLEPVEDKVGGLPDALLLLVDGQVREALEEMGASFAPPGEDKRRAAALVRNRQLKAYQLRLQVLPGSAPGGLKVEMLVMSYPEQALKGSWNVKASGAKPETLIKAIVPRVVADAAGDLEWK